MKKALLACFLPLLLQVKGCEEEQTFLMEFTAIPIGAALVFVLLLIGRLLARAMRPKEGQPNAGIAKYLLFALIAAIVLDGIFFGASAGIYKAAGVAKITDFEDKTDLRMDLYAIEFVTWVRGDKEIPVTGGNFHLFIWNYWLINRLDYAMFDHNEVGWLCALAWNQALNIVTFFLFILIGIWLRKRAWLFALLWLIACAVANVVIYRSYGYYWIFQ